KLRNSLTHTERRLSKLQEHPFKTANDLINDYLDKQESSVQLDTSTNTVATVFDNVADATYQGIEIETQWVVSEHLSLFANFGWLDAEYENFETDINPSDGVPLIEDASFLTPRNAPEYTYGVGGTVNYEVGPGELEFFAKYAWVDEIESDLLNLDVGKLDSREDLSASIGYYYENMSVVLFGRNLTDDTFEIPFLIFPLFASGTVTPGATWGLTVSFDLGAN
ncbi:MAG: TonB-dependent receptor, partial [Gammaproteobacteria bacterium]|nr:TonB-dependent receptor [Gammaproteobacteria bacterium]